MTTKIEAEKLKKSFRLEREAYQHMIKKYRRGDVTYVQIDEEERAANVIFIGAEYEEEFEVKKLYKSLNVIKPDMVMIQVRPDLVLERFKGYEEEIGEEKEEKYMS